MARSLCCELHGFVAAPNYAIPVRAVVTTVVLATVPTSESSW